METVETAEIWHIPNQEIQASNIVRLTKEMANDLIDKVWWENIPGEKRDDEWDDHWVWTELIAERESDGAYEFLAIVSKENYVEGAMIYKSVIDSKLEGGSFCGYIDYIASAPRNRAWVVTNPVYGGVGTVLTYKAVKRSYESALGGKVFLQSLPRDRTMEFYRKIGFERTDLAQPLTDLISFELPEAKAKEWLEKQGDL